MVQYPLKALANCVFAGGTYLADKGLKFHAKRELHTLVLTKLIQGTKPINSPHSSKVRRVDVEDDLEMMFLPECPDTPFLRFRVSCWYYCTDTS